MWPTFPGLGGLSVRTDLKIGIKTITSGAVIATCKQCVCKAGVSAVGSGKGVNFFRIYTHGAEVDSDVRVFPGHVG